LIRYRRRVQRPTEAVNLLIKKIKLVGHGFRNFDNYRLRLLLHCGVDWDTIHATPSEVGYHAQPREPDWRLSARALIAAQFTTEGRVSCLITR
jgi:hypothetical protein